MKQNEQNVIAKIVNVNDTVYSIKDMADMLRISPNGVRKRIARGLMPAHRNGGRLYRLKSEYIEAIRES